MRGLRQDRTLGRFAPAEVVLTGSHGIAPFVGPPILGRFTLYRKAARRLLFKPAWFLFYELAGLGGR